MIADLDIVLRAARNSLRENGVLKTIWLALPYLRNRVGHLRETAGAARWTEMERKDAFDARYGTETSGFVELEALGVSEEARSHSSSYKPTLPRVFHRVMSELRIRHEDFVFIDYGSGKGRSLLLASDYPFRRIVGVELSPVLHEIADRNLAIYRSPRQRCCEIELKMGDAGAVEPPRDAHLVCYFYYPFDEELLGRVLAKISAAVEGGKRQAWLLFINPPEPEVVEAAVIFELVAATHRPWRVDRWLNWRIYRTKRVTSRDRK
jgi:hypothetical protein